MVIGVSGSGVVSPNNDTRPRFSDVNNVSTVARFSPPAVDWVAVRKGLKLTLREVEVIQGIWAGQQFQQIARSLSISGHTCDTHWRHIRTKLGVHCRVGVVHAVYGAMSIHLNQNSQKA